MSSDRTPLRIPTLPQEGGLPPEPAHGFLGRDRQIEELTELLSQATRPVWIHGYAGVGKTALAAHAARELASSGRFQQVAYTSFAGGALADSALRDLWHSLRPEESFPGADDALDGIDPALTDAELLLIWDDLDVALQSRGTALAQLAELAAKLRERKNVRLCCLADGLGSPPNAGRLGTAAGELTLEGLESQTALSLLRQIADEDAKTWDDAQAGELVEAFGGHPLALSILASMLNERPVDQLYQELVEFLPGLAHGEGRLRNQSLTAALEYMLRHTLNSGQRDMLRALGVFRCGGAKPMLQKATQFSDEHWASLISYLVQGGLWRDERIEGYGVPYVRLHSALIDFFSRRLGAAPRQTFEKRYLSNYVGLLSWIMQILRRSPGLAQRLFLRELPNLRHTLELLEASDDLTALNNYAGSFLTLLGALGLSQESQLLAERVQSRTRSSIPAEGPLDHQAVHFLLQQSSRLIAARRVPQAAQLLQQVCQRISEEDGLTYSGDQAARDRADAFRRLARLARSSRQWGIAIGAYLKAINYLRQATMDKQIHGQLLALYSDLSEIYILSEQVEAAQEACEKALREAEVLQDDDALSGLHARLATISQGRDQLEEAQEHLDVALERARAANNKVAMATIWDQIAGLQLAQPDQREQARESLTKALQLAREQEHATLQGQILLKLGRIAEQEGDLEQAESHYRSALDAQDEQGAPASVASIRTALARVLAEKDELEAAQEQAESALQSVEVMDQASLPVWQIYNVLERIAQRRSQDDVAADWRRRAQKAFASSPQASRVRRQWRELIDAVVSALHGEAMDMDTAARIEALEEDPEMASLADAIWRIMGGEKGEALFAELDSAGSVIVQTILDESEVERDTE